MHKIFSKIPAIETFYRLVVDLGSQLYYKKWSISGVLLGIMRNSSGQLFHRTSVNGRFCFVSNEITSYFWDTVLPKVTAIIFVFVVNLKCSNCLGFRWL